MVHGTRDKRKNTHEPKPGGVAQMPEWLCEAAQLEWIRLSGDLFKIGLITKADEVEFAVYCQAYAEIQEAEDALGKFGRTQVTKDGFERKSPWLSIRDEAWKRLHQAAQQFGLTPASRTKIEVPEQTALDDKSRYIA
jgi:P27 family predicted phage terminase small subunit